MRSGYVRSLSPTGEHHRSASAPTAFSSLTSGFTSSSSLWQPQLDRQEEDPPIAWPEIKLNSGSNPTSSRRLGQVSPLPGAGSGPGSEAELPAAESSVDLVKRDASESSKASTSVRPPEPSRRQFDGTWLGPNGRWAYLAHLASLAGAEFPATEHRQWLGVTQMPRSTPEPAKPRASLKRRLLLGMGSSHPRFVPLDNLEETYAGNRKRRRLLYALRKHHMHTYNSWWDRLSNEVFIHCQLFFDRCTPRRLRAHLPWACSAYLIICCIAFAFMAGEYPTFLGTHGDPHAVTCAADFRSGPQSLWSWLTRWDDCHVFSDAYLIQWGARYAPKLNQGKQWWRWLSSFVVFNSFGAFATNSLLFAALGLHIESRYTTRRTILFILLAGVGGNFFDASWGGSCGVVTSGGGVTAGFVGLYVADFCLNFQSIKFPINRLAATALTLAIFVVTCAVHGYPYRYSLPGGFLAALFPSLLMLPHIRSETIEWAVPPLALFFTLGICLALPLYLYLVRLPRAQCPAALT